MKPYEGLGANKLHIDLLNVNYQSAKLTKQRYFLSQIFFEERRALPLFAIWISSALCQY